jgi:quercetin dioxygenase-like cupin family protein
MCTQPLVAAALLLAGGAIGASQAQTGAISRTDVVRGDLDAKREAIQVRVDFAPGAAFPMHNHPVVEIAYVLEGALEYKLGSQAPVTLTACRAPA